MKYNIQYLLDADLQYRGNIGIDMIDFADNTTKGARGFVTFNQLMIMAEENEQYEFMMQYQNDNMTYSGN